MYSNPIQKETWIPYSITRGNSRNGCLLLYNLTHYLQTRSPGGSLLKSSVTPCANVSSKVFVATRNKQKWSIARALSIIYICINIYKWKIQFFKTNFFYEIALFFWKDIPNVTSFPQCLILVVSSNKFRAQIVHS